MAGFEDNLKKLEKIVDDLHSEKLSLEKSIERFEEGVKIADSCIKSLDSMRKKIEIVSKGKDGKLKIKPFEQEKD
ncbi:MAG TPA: exodeoxyribonuclease VII small subunit [Candidatus Omnitrophota bacterium]|nr:exodeoxyribonuclease VII small subunit [Candidatus Omnitrophota bacterium]